MEGTNFIYVGIYFIFYQLTISDYKEGRSIVINKRKRMLVGTTRGIMTMAYLLISDNEKIIECLNNKTLIKPLRWEIISN